jgi:hypothetical protein
MRRALLYCAAIVLAIACGESITEPIPDRSPVALPAALKSPTIAFATTTTEDGLSISTDKDDYQPGDTVYFTGSGWQPEDVLDIVLTDEPLTHDPHTWTIDVAEDGTFRDSTYVVDVGDLGVTFTLTATSRANPDQTLTVQFTDAVQTAPVATREATCTTAQTSFTLGATVCANAGPVTTSGAGNNDFRIQWIGPSPSTTILQTAAFTGVSNNSTHTDTFEPTDVGTYTVRTCAGASNPCTGGNLLSSATFTVTAAANAPPNDPANLAQFKSNGTTSIPTGGATSEATVVLKGLVSDPNAANTVKLQVEVRLVGTSFTNAHTHESVLIANGGTASVNVPSLAEGSYHWQARAVDNNGAMSNWVIFGGNDETATDFRVDLTPPTVTIEQASGQADPTNASPINFTVVFSEDVDDFVTGDVSLSGTAGATTQLVTGSGTTYNVAVSGMTGDGTVIASIAAGVASDAAGNLNQASTSTDNEVTYDTTPPVVSNVQASPNPSDGTGNVVLTATATDALTKVTSAEYNIDGGGFSPMAASDGGFDELAEDVTVTISAATLAEGSRTLCVRATDEATNRSGDAAACTTLIVDRTPPAISNFAVSPNPVAVNTPFTISATFTDALTNVTDAQYSLGGTGGPWVILPNAGGSYDSQTENGSITLSLPNADVLDVCVRSTDQVGNTNQPAPGTNPIQCIFLAVYDPTAGFVTGGGWIDSPSSACPIFCSGAVGKATFGFVSKYITQKDKTTPVLTGNTEFQFHAGNVNFKSTNYEWLVVSGNGTRAQYKGTGTMNGQAGYGFLLTALESPDRFRMKIWDATGTIYDNQWEKADSGNDATLLGGGSIIIHVPKK